MAGGPATILLKQGELKITDSVAIDGPGADLLIIDASGNDPTPELNNGDGSRVFNIDNGQTGNLSEVSIGSLRLTGGDLGNFQYGGAILNRENLTITDSVIKGNAAEGNGGGISNLPDFGATNGLTVVNCTISGNLALNGGAIDSRGCYLTLTGSTISGNSALRCGGGVSFFGFDITLNVSDSTISGNSTVVRGGGLYVNQGNLTLLGSSINNNLVRDDGGGIFFIGGNLKLTDSSIVGNSITSADGNYYSGGISILGVDAYVSVVNSTISGNSGFGVISHYDVAVSGSTFVGNLRGGLVARTATVANSAINNNAGRGIEAFTIVITSSMINENGEGGGVAGSYVTVTDSEINRNSASGIVGSHITVTKSMISGNSTSGAGGGIHSRDKLSLVDSLVSGNSAHNEAGGIFSGGTALIVNSTISGNSSREGGGLYITGSGRTEVRHSTIAFNSARDLGHGSGIFIDGATLTLDHAIVGRIAASIETSMDCLARRFPHGSVWLA